MIVTKGIKFKSLLTWSGIHLIWLTAFISLVSVLYHFDIIGFYIPWLPISVIGTAVAFYVGFKNNQAYDRMWEARKIWGAIVNESRSWGMMVDGFITNQFTDKELDEKEIQAIKKRLIYRHIAWLYTHRKQLLVPTEWEHISQKGFIGKAAKIYQDRFGVGRINQKIYTDDIKENFSEEEIKRLTNHKNTATQIINEQSKDLAKLHKNGVIDNFRHMEMIDLLRSFYTQQGKNERIKKFPLPRQYANMSRYFIGIFILLLPFSMVPELMKIDSWGVWISIPITVLIGWIYVMMEIVADYTENPFQSMGNDIPMLSLCRTIEIDLREMLGEEDLPPPIESVNGILM